MWKRGNLLAFCLSTAVLFLLWALLTSGFKPQESLVGIFAASLSTFLFLLVRLKSGSLFHPRLRDLLALWRLPWYLVSGSWEITLVLFQDLLGVRKAGSHYRSSPYDPAAAGPLEGRSRQALAVAYTTVAPNFIVVGIDTKRKQMLFHQLRPSSVPKMTKELGARG